jgi:hypothetical protein
LLAAVWGVLFIRALITMGRAADSASWPEIDGEIFHSRLANRGNFLRHSWYPDIRYSFTIDGHECVGRRLSFGGLGDTTFLKAASQRAADRFPAGRKVKVRVCPGDAALCTLESGMSRYNALDVAYTFIGLGTSLGLLIRDVAA